MVVTTRHSMGVEHHSFTYDIQPDYTVGKDREELPHIQTFPFPCIDVHLALNFLVL